MATFKHISSKNADYSAAEKYLTFEHDEICMKPVLDEKGRLIPRENVRFTTLNCGGDNYAITCLRANKRFGKNLTRGEIKSHHYITERKEMLSHLRSYARTRKVREEYDALKTERQRQAFQEAHTSDFILMDADRKYFRERGYKPLPKIKDVQGELDRLYAEKNARYEEYKARKAEFQELATLRQNIRQIRGESERDKAKEKPTKS